MSFSLHYWKKIDCYRWSSKTCLSKLCVLSLWRLCGSSVFSGSGALSPLLSWKHSLNHVTLCILSDLHWVFVVIWKLNTTQGQPLLNALLCSQKKAKVRIGSRGERLNILPKFRCWFMAQKMSGWARVTDEKFWKCWVDLKQKREYIMAVGQSPEATDCKTGAAWQVSDVPFWNVTFSWFFNAWEPFLCSSLMTGGPRRITEYQSECR